MSKDEKDKKREEKLVPGKYLKMLKTVEPRCWVYVVHCTIVSTLLDVSNFNEKLKLKKKN